MKARLMCQEQCRRLSVLGQCTICARKLALVVYYVFWWVFFPVLHPFISFTGD